MKENGEYIEENLTSASHLAKKDYDDIMKGSIVTAAIIPLESETQAEHFRKRCFFAPSEWMNKRVHVYLVFFNPLTNTIDATTSYNSPTNPPYLIYRSQNDPLGLYPNGELKKESYHNPGHKRDIDAVLVPRKRLKYKTRTLTIKNLDPTRLAKSLKYFREWTKRKIIENNLLLYDSEFFSPGSKPGIADCQTGTIWAFQRAFPNEKLPIPEGTYITRCSQKYRDIIYIQ